MPGVGYWGTKTWVYDRDLNTDRNPVGRVGWGGGGWGGPVL